MAFDSMEWKQKLSNVLKEHPDIGRATGVVEINLNEGEIAKIYLNKKIRNISEATAWFDHLKDKVENVIARVIIG